MKRGFTLIEITVVLAIIGLVIGGGMATLTAGVQQNAYNATVTTMNAIDQALYNYANAFGRLPCPASLTLPPTNSGYGLEAGALSGGVGTGECITGMTPAATNGSSSSAEEGGVPVRALLLSDSYMYDGWGRKIRYAVDPGYTVASGLNGGPIPSNICNVSTRALTVYDGSGTSNARTTAGIYVLVSPGSTGHGGYSMYSGTTMFNAGNSHSDVLTNCHCTSSAGTNGYNSAYVQEVPNYSSAHKGNAAYFFDDIVSFREPWQVANQYTSIGGQVNCASLANNIWYSDPGNCVVVAMSKSGTALMTLGTMGNCSSGNYLFSNPSPPTIDKYGNIWVPDSGNNRIMEYSGSGTFMHSYGSGGSAGGLFEMNGSSAQIAFDNSATPPNLWVTDVDNNRIQEFTYSSGSSSTATYAYKTSISIPNSSSHNALPTGIAVTQIAGVTTLWVNTQGSSATLCGVYLCSTSGTCNQATGVTCGNGVTQFGKVNSNPSNYLTLDASGNVWSVDENNGVIHKLSSGGVYSGTNLSISSNPGGLTGTVFDSTGNPWLSSESSNEIIRINASTGTQIGNAITSVSGMTLQYPQTDNNYTYNATR